MIEIRATTEPIYFVARDDDGTVLHVGITEPGQVTTTGQKNLIHGDKVKQEKELEKYLGAKPKDGKEYDYDLNERKWLKVEVEK